MEQPRVHDKKKNTKTILNIGAGAGSFGIGGIVLFGGALVTATIVSVLAFKRRKQHKSSSSDNIKNNMSPSPETQTVDVSNKLELMMKCNKDFSTDFSHMEHQSDGLTRMKKMETETLQNLTQDEKHNFGIDNDEEVDSGDSNEDIIFSVDGEPQENTLIYVDSVFKSREVDSSYEKVVLECDEQLVMEAQIEEDSCVEKDDGGEEQKELLRIDNENDEQVDTKSLVSDEAVTSIEEYEAIEVPLGDDVGKASEKEDVDQEIVFVNGEAATEVSCVNQVNVEDNHQVQFLEKENDTDGDYETIYENCGDLSDETGCADQTVHVMEEEPIDAAHEHQTEVQNGPHVQHIECQDETIMENYERDLSMQCSSEQVMGEEVIKAACVDLVDTEDILEVADHEVGLDAQDMQVNKGSETFVVSCIMDSLKKAAEDLATGKEDPPSQLVNTEEKGKETAQKIEEHVTIEDEVVSEGEMPHVQLIEEAEADDQTVKIEDKPPRQSVNEEEKEDVTAVQVEAAMITEDELVKKEGISKKDDIPQVESTEKNVTVRSDGSSDELKDSPMTPEAKIGNHNSEENMEQNNSDQNGIIKEDKSSKSALKFLIELAKGKKQALASELWNLKLMTWSLLVSIWCLCHWYSELPFPELSLVGSLLFVLILLGYTNRTRYLVKYEYK